MKNTSKIKVIGLMSGTSLDGLDICYVSFEKKENMWSYDLLAAKTFAYTNEWLTKIKSAQYLDSVSLMGLDIEYGYFLGDLANTFIKENKIDVHTIDLVSSHGHTIHHQPHKNITLQIGHGAAIMSKIKIKVVCDFRTQDMILGGQGAPLVPIGDKYLFHSFDACLNLGGFSNVSYKNKDSFIAFDICAVNTVLNHLTQVFFNKEYDEDGQLAKNGLVIPTLLSELNAVVFYRLKSPKSLGIEFVQDQILPLLNNYKNKQDVLTTYTEHIAIQIALTLNELDCNNLLITGGGAKNNFLIERIKANTQIKIQLPNTNLIDFKEALIFAFLGVLKITEEINVLSSVTGASRDHSSGVIYNFN